MLLIPAHQFARTTSRHFGQVVCGIFMLLALAGPSVKAVDVYNTLNQSVTFDGNLNDTTWTALSFSTTAAEYMISDVTLPIWNQNALNSGSVTLSIYDSAGVGSRPGSKIGSDLGSAAVSGFSSSGYQNYTITGVGRTLLPSTQYYLVVNTAGVSGTGSNNVSIGFQSGTGGITTNSLGYSQSLNAGTSWGAPNTSFTLIGAVAATVPVPEPSTYALAAIASTVMAAIARRRKASKA